jgi:hypothetical protein
MKNVKSGITRSILFAAGLATVGLTGASAQESVTTTTTSAGTVSQFSPDAITVTTGAAAPVSYTYTKTTTYVDENGNPVATDVVRSGVPVTVYYTRDGDRMLATKVIVRRAEVPATDATVIKKTTTTTTTTGTMQ